MTAAELDTILSLRRQGETCKAIAKKVNYSYWTVVKRVKQAGLTDTSWKNRLKSKQAMMLHDWQAGLDTEKIAKKYGYKSTNALCATIALLRKKGYKFDKRTCWSVRR